MHTRPMDGTVVLKETLLAGAHPHTLFNLKALLIHFSKFVFSFHQNTVLV